MGRAMRDFTFVYLPLYLRAFAIFLIFASPVLAALHFHDALCYFEVSRPVLRIVCAVGDLDHLRLRS